MGYEAKAIVVQTEAPGRRCRPQHPYLRSRQDQHEAICTVPPQTSSAGAVRELEVGQVHEGGLPRTLLSCWALQEVRTIHRVVCALETCPRPRCPFPAP